ncbi:penicillin-binding Tp47 domain C-containing protein [Blautia sp. HCP3S3_H10_1]|uniref:penicillin-binding Tp47 domain C-containing protein n=1 Tax=unclassified Blautia TaxID=2648079 RepID=UPI003F92E520
MMGKTISSVTYYTSKGIINFDVEDTYVPVITGVTATAADVKTSDTALKVEFSAELPADFSKVYTVDGVKAEAENDTVKIADLAMGQHEVVISDANGKYAPISTTFEAKTDVKPAVYNEYEIKLAAAKDITAEQFEVYVKAISKVKIGDKEYAATGRGAVTVVKEDGTLDFSNAPVAEGDTVTVYATGYENVTFTYSESVYVYAGLTWAQYWAAENVLNAGSSASSDLIDRHGEKDLGAFDTVTRATSNHGLHRGSFQTIATVYTTAGNSYKLAGWKDQATMILTDGSTVAFGRGTVNGETIDHYVVTGLKYVPVKVKRADYTAFKDTYTVVENGGTLFGGYGEGNLASYSAVAAVNGNTNGLKTAVKSEDGTFTFSARANGSDSGLKDAAQKTADGITATVKPGNGSYGEFLRVDLTGNYGGLGAAMQAVKWTYYGNDSSYSTPLQSYGTKFAADNWMHKAQGIQLGLSDSLRCELPEGYDGTGYWTLTVYGLGYADYTVRFQATEENIAKPAGDADSTPLENIIAEAKALNEADYTPESWAAAKDSIANELEECEDMLANIKEQTTYGVEEQIGHLREALDTLVKAQFSLSAETSALDTDKNTTTTLKVTTNLTGTVTWTSSDAKVATVDANGKVAAVKAGTATITATLGGKSASSKVTVKEVVKPTPTPAPVLTAKAQASTIYAGGTTGSTTVISVTKSGITEAAKFTSSDPTVATVDANGKVTAKKAGTTTITVTAGKLSVKVNVTVVQAGVTAKAGNAVIYTKGLKTTKITATKNAISGTVKYTSSNKKVATVSSKGVVTAKKAGKTTITVKVGKYSTKVTIQVKNPALKLAKSSATIKKGKTVTIKATATPSGKVTYKTSNKKVATVTAKGVVKGKKKGTATITVTCNGVSKKFKVKVK